MGYFRWITGCIASNGEDVVQVVGGLGVTSQKIKKNTLNFKAKAWWTLARHRLFPTTGDNILSPIRVAMIVRFMARYEFDVREFLAQEMGDRDVCREKLLLAYPCVIT
ncbi:hypothetical protein FXO37_23313 [Capsicum annuum]|nr:hypothetical protein FXO37_23313 [Capsicum annuum]